MTGLTWINNFGVLPRPYDYHACSSPRRDFALSPASVSPNTYQKRKRADSQEVQPKAWSVGSHGLAPPICQGYPGTSYEMMPHAQGTRNASMPQVTEPVANLKPIHALHSTQTQPGPVDVARQPDSVHTEIAQPQVAPRVSESQVAMQNKTIDRIEAYLNLQILEKHNELRLIETEMGKAQIMLEQLRRCSIVPYPSSSATLLGSEQIVTGTGPALASTPGMTRPPHAPAFGVLDGPYSRHYERWLIHDEAFDTVAARVARSAAASAVPSPISRKRAAIDEPMPVRQPKRTASSAVPQLSTIPVIGADGRPILVVQREDGVWVKVVCKICGKRDSANLQGFTNHTRIAHSLTYTNHKEAIKECGQALNEDEAAQVTATTSIQQPFMQHAAPPLQPMRNAKPTLPQLAVAGSSRQSSSGSQLAQHVDDTEWRKSLPLTPISAAQPDTPVARNFFPSTLAPHLSQKLAKLGSTVDLGHMVAASKMGIDLDQVQSLYPDVNDELPTPTSATPTSHRPRTANVPGMRMPAATPVPSSAPARVQATPLTSSVSAVPHLQQTSHIVSAGRTSSVAPGQTKSSSSHGAGLGYQDLTPEHSPTTVDLNPGMISDHDDESDYHHSSDHGDYIDQGNHDGYMHVLSVQGEHGYGDPDLQYHDLHTDHVMQCQPGPIQFTDPVYFAAPQVPLHQKSSFAPTEKKKRGRPRKSENPPLK